MDVGCPPHAGCGGEGTLRPWVGGQNAPAKFTGRSGSGQRRSSRWPRFPLENGVFLAVCRNVKIKCAVTTRQMPKAKPEHECRAVRGSRGRLQSPRASW